MVHTVISAGRSFIEAILKRADVQIDGNRPWDMRVQDNKLFDRIIQGGSLGLGEAYIDGWWECDDLAAFFCNVLRARIDEALPTRLTDVMHALRVRLLNEQSRQTSTEVAKRHYDLGNDFYGAMLDPYRQYSCGYFDETSDLAEAQRKKMDLICRKLQLKKSDRVLDIGCGWG